MQEDRLFSGSIADNICFFDPLPDMARIEASARLASIGAEILEMPMAYNTLTSDQGVGLLGGQVQRILLAWALYRRGDGRSGDHHPRREDRHRPTRPRVACGCARGRTLAHHLYSTCGSHRPICGKLYISTIARIWMPMNGIIPAKIWFSVTCRGLTPFR